MQGAGKFRLKRDYSDMGKAGLTHGKPMIPNDNVSGVSGAGKPGKSQKRNWYGLELVERWALR